MTEELSKGFTGIEINGVRFSNIQEMLIYMNKQRNEIILLEKENAELNKKLFKAEEEYDKAFKDGAEFGYNKANEWHKVSDKLPEMDMIVYLWHENESFPVCAYRHIPYGKTEKDWVWECYWGSGYTVTQSVAKDYWWKEIVLPKEIKE